MRRAASGLIAAAALAAAALVFPQSPAVPGEPPTRSLTLLVSSGSSGKLVSADGSATVASLVATVRREAARARGAGREVVVMDAGRTLAPYAESRFDRGATMIEVLQAAGCQLFAPAPLDFSVGLGEMSRLAEAAGFPVLRPVASGEPASGLAERAILNLADGLRVEVVNLTDAVFKGDLEAAGFADGTPLTVKEPGADEGSALRVAVVHSRGQGSSMVSRQLTWSLVEDARGLQLLLDPDLGQDVVLRLTSATGPVFLVGRREDKDQPWSVTRVDVELEAGEGGAWRPRSVELEVLQAELELAVDPALEGVVRAAFERFRDAHSQPLPAAAPADRDGLCRFVLGAMREAARAEVAVLNRGALRPVAASFFAGERPTREAVVRLLSIDQELVVVELSGDKLAALVADSVTRVDPHGAPRKDALEILGVSWELDGTTVKKLQVNGRELYPKDLYTVVTNAYLVAGGDGYAVLDGLDGVVLEDGEGRPLELRDGLVLPRLADAGRPFPALERLPLWRYGVDHIRLVFDAVTTSHDAAYDGVSDSRARAVDSGSLLTDWLLWADRQQPAWTWENDLRLRFGLVDSEGAERRELDDDIQLDSAAVFSTLDLLGGHPFANLKLDSELRPNTTSDGVELPRQLEETLGVGISWSAPHWPRLRLAAVARHYSNIERSDQLGFSGEAWYEIDSADGRRSFDARVLVEQLGGDDLTVRRLDLDLRLELKISERLRFTPGYNYYLYDDSSLDGSSRYGRLTLGLAYAWSGKHQRW